MKVSFIVLLICKTGLTTNLWPFRLIVKQSGRARRLQFRHFSTCFVIVIVSNETGDDLRIRGAGLQYTWTASPTERIAQCPQHRSPLLCSQCYAAKTDSKVPVINVFTGPERNRNTHLYSINTPSLSKYLNRPYAKVWFSKEVRLWFVTEGH